MIDLGRMNKIMEPYQGDTSAVVKALQAVQEEWNYLPKEALLRVAQSLGVPLSEVLRVATFYRAFSLTPKKKHCISVCLGTACHVRGAARLYSKLESALAMGGGGGDFSLEAVRCIGCCSMAPALRIDGDTHGRVRLDRVTGLLGRYRKEESQ
jgi:NADH-quinone oxidoreductase subunit E